MKERAGVMMANWALTMTALLLMGCASTQPAQFYSLGALDRMQNVSSDLSVGEKVAIGIGPVDFPELVKRQQIVTRTGSHKFHVDEFHRWGGPLDEDFTRVLAENISTLMGTDRVAVFPWEAYFQPVYRVLMTVQGFDGRLGGPVALHATWTILDGEANELTTKRSFIEQPASGGDYEELVSAESRALATLSREIAEEIHRLAFKGGL